MSDLAPDFGRRQERLRRELREQKIGSLLVTCPFNVTYLTGFTGEDSFLFVAKDQFTIISDGRYEEQLQQECPDSELLIRPSTLPIIDAAAKHAHSLSVNELAVESLTTTLAQFERLQELLKSMTIRSTKGVVERLRERKDPSEVAAIERAVSMAQRAFVATISMMTSQSTEKELANSIDTNIRNLGGAGSAFKSIVGVGPRAALPHGRPSHMTVGESGFVLVDWGAKEDLYLSDLTRVVITGKVNSKFEKVYQTVLAAQEAAIRAIRPGILMSEVDAIARKVIEQAGFGKRFTHGLGHSFGLQIHETIRLAKGQDRPLETDMVVTAEPGIYLPGVCGVRIEDDVLVTKGGNRVLTSLPKDWDSVHRLV